jgi:hypothetical protein
VRRHKHRASRASRSVFPPLKTGCRRSILILEHRFSMGAGGGTAMVVCLKIL